MFSNLNMSATETSPVFAMTPAPAGAAAAPEIPLSLARSVLGAAERPRPPEGAVLSALLDPV